MMVECEKARYTTNCSVSMILCTNYGDNVQLPQPLLSHTDQPPVACSDQLIKLLFGSLWDVFCLFVSKFLHQFKKRKTCTFLLG